jgi:hypothetical protein
LRACAGVARHLVLAEPCDAAFVQGVFAEIIIRSSRHRGRPTRPDRDMIGLARDEECAVAVEVKTIRFEPSFVQPT